MHRCLAVFVSILIVSLILACSVINPPSLTDIEEREAEITSRVQEVDQLANDAESHSECRNVLNRSEERMERRTALLGSAMVRMMFDTADADQRSEVYDLMGQILELLDEVEVELLACMPPTPTPNPGEQAWLQFEEWFRANSDSLGYLNVIPRLPECSHIASDEYFGIFVSANNSMGPNYIGHNYGFSFGELAFLDLWESRYRTGGEEPSEFPQMITEMAEIEENALRNACLEVSEGVSQLPTRTGASAPQTVVHVATQLPTSTSLPTATQRPNPTPSPIPLSFLSLSAGNKYTCGIIADGSIVCWGDNRESRATPPKGSFKSISAEELHICGVKVDNTIACWGYHDTRRGTPPQAFFNTMSVGDLHTCGVEIGGFALCWGYNESGQAAPPPISFASISAGGFHTCGVTTEGAAVCWGVNYEGRSTPPGGTYKDIDAGTWHTCGIRTDGTVVCWGDDGDSEEGGGRATPPIGSFTSVSANTYHTCGVRTDNTVSCWGDDRFGQSTPPPGSFTSVSAGVYHACGVRTDGTAVCWGRNDSGEADAPR